MNIQVFEEIDSTQLEAKRQIDAENFIDDKIIFAIKQTNSITTKKGIPWQANKGDVLMSWITNSNGKVFNINHIPFCCSLAIYDVLLGEIENTIKQTDDLNKKNLLTHTKIEIKWPNDVLVNKRKISGILSELYKNHLIVGIALNLTKNNFITTRMPAIDLETLIGRVIDNKTFTVNLYQKIKEYIKMLQQYGFSKIKEKWKQHAYMLGEVVEKDDGNFVVFNDIDNNGDII